MSRKHINLQLMQKMRDVLVALDKQIYAGPLVVPSAIRDAREAYRLALDDIIEWWGTDGDTPAYYDVAMWDVFCTLYKDRHGIKPTGLGLSLREMRQMMDEWGAMSFSGELTDFFVD